MSLRILHEKTLIFLPSDSQMIARERRLEFLDWMGIKMIAFTMQREVIEVSEHTLGCQEPRTFKKCSQMFSIPQHTTI